MVLRTPRDPLPTPTPEKKKDIQGILSFGIPGDSKRRATLCYKPGVLLRLQLPLPPGCGARGGSRAPGQRVCLSVLRCEAGRTLRS